MTTPTDIDVQHAKTSLFEDLPEPSAAQLQQAQAQVTSKRAQGSPRLLQPNRLQIELRASDLESLLAQDHRARLVWGYVVHQNLNTLVEAIKALNKALDNGFGHWKWIDHDTSLDSVRTMPAFAALLSRRPDAGVGAANA